MNEYERLISYLKKTIDEIITKRNSINNQNAQQLLIKSSLENIIQLLSSYQIDKINVSELNNLLSSLIPNNEIEEIKNKLTELLSVQSFLFDERVSNPIKQIMLKDLDTIRIRLSFINKSLVQLSLSEEETNLLEQCQKYIELVNKDGYTKILSDEERSAFYNFLKSINFDDNLLLIFDYITYANRNRKRHELNTSNTAIEIVNKNAEKVLAELEQNLKSTEKERIKPQITRPIQPKINMNPLCERITELLKMHESDINSATYDVYAKYYSEMDIHEIYGDRSSFSTFDGVNWERAIPCIKERLLPNVDSEEQNIIFKIFSEIIALNQEQLERYQQHHQQQEAFKNRLAVFKEEFVSTTQQYSELKSQLKPIVEKVITKTRNDKTIIASLLETIQNQTTEDIGIGEYLSHYEVSYEELQLYKLNSIIESNINDIKEYIELEMLSEEDFKEIHKLLNDTKDIIDECQKTYEAYNSKEKNLIPSTNKKQYEYGNSIIVFFRRTEDDKFLVEEDIDKQLLDEVSYNDIFQILRKTSEISCDEWGKVLSDSSHFKSFIDYNKQNGSRGEVVKIKSNFSGKSYEFFRLKYKGKTIPRLSAFDIDMCDENRKKLGIPKDKHIILIIGEKQVTKYSNESADYSDVRRELRINEDLIAKYIELFENPNTNEEVLYRILNDSSDLYNYFKGKTKGLGE